MTQLNSKELDKLFKQVGKNNTRSKDDSTKRNPEVDAKALLFKNFALQSLKKK